MNPFPIELKPRLREKAEKLHVLPRDIQESFVLGSGKGGQKINKTSSCVVLKHLPTGLMVRCQKHREQSKNRLSAYRMLLEKIEETLHWEDSEKARKIYKVKKQKQKRSKRAKEKILEAKKQRSVTKEQRKKVNL